MIKIAIIDDDKGFLIKYKSMTEKFMNGTDMDYTVDTYDSAKAVLESAMDYELYCLDVEMPEINGFQLAERIRQVQGMEPDILFVSVSERAVFDVFRYHVLGFVRKTHIENDMQEAMQRFVKAWEDKKKEFEFVTKDGRCFRKMVTDLIYAEVRGHTLELYCNDGVYNVKGTLSELEQRLHQYDFVQPYKGFLVNCGYIDMLGQRELHLKTEDRKVIPLSRYKATEIRSMFIKYINS